MTDRKYIRPVPESLKSDYGREYPTDMLKEAYIRSEQGLKGFCRRYGLKESQVRRLIDSGAWDEARNTYRERMYRTLAKDRLETLEWRQDLIGQMEKLELIGVEDLLEDISKQFTDTGSLLVKDSQGEIMRDPFGNPIVRGIPKYVKDALKTSHEIRELNTHALILANTADAPQLPTKPEQGQLPPGQAEDEKTVDVESYGLFEDADKK